MSDLWRVWQNQNTENKSMTLQELRDRLRRLHAKTLRRMLMNCATGMVIVILFIVILLRTDMALHRLGWTLAIVGALFAMTPSFLQLWRMRPGEALEAEGGRTTTLAFYRRLLETHRSLRLGSRWTALALASAGI
jgi:hypothetical protein